MRFKFDITKEEEEEAAIKRKIKVSLVVSTRQQCTFWNNSSRAKMSTPHNKCTALKCAAFKNVIRELFEFGPWKEVEVP